MLRRADPAVNISGRRSAAAGGNGYGYDSLQSVNRASSRCLLIIISLHTRVITTITLHQQKTQLATLTVLSLSSFLDIFRKYNELTLVIRFLVSKSNSYPERFYLNFLTTFFLG